jgi:hypothetical protein
MVMPANQSLHRRAVAILRDVPRLMSVLETARTLELPDWLLFSGAVYQPILNHLTGRDPEHGFKDYGLGYFDGSDLSYGGEDEIIRRAATVFDESVGGLAEVRNQARVHLWFEARFGHPYAPLSSTAEALTRFTSPTFAVGVRLESDGDLTIVAPFGLDDLFALRLRPRAGVEPAGFERTAASATSRWPELRMID